MTTSEVRPGPGTAAPSRTRVRGLVTAVVAVVVGIAAAALGWFRLPPVARDTLWAEDSRLFLAERVDLGPIATVFHPYDGYLHVLPRILVDLATALPVVDYARAVTALSCLVVGAVAAGTVVFSAGSVRTMPARVALALVPVMTPVVAFEVLGNFANLHSFLLFLVPVLLLVRPRTWGGSVAPALVALLIALSEIQSVVFVPMLLLMVRRRRAWPTAAAFLVGLAAQLVSTAFSARSRTPVDQRLVDVVRGWLFEPVVSTFIPNGGRAGAFLAEHGTRAAVLLALPFLAAAVIALVGRPGDGRWWTRPRILTVVFLVASPLVWGVDLVLNPTPLIDFTATGPVLIATVGFVRYAAVPSMFLLALGVMAADALLGRPRVVLRTGGLVMLLLVVVLVVWRYEPYAVARSLGPAWTTSFEQAEQACTTGSGSEQIAGAPTGWSVTLRCSDIRSDAFP